MLRRRAALVVLGVIALGARSAREETIMAKGQKRSGREAKKPKAEKKKPATATSVFTEPPSKRKPPSA